MTIYFHSISPGLVAIATETPGFSFGWGTDMPEITALEYENHPIRIRYTISSRIPKPPKDGLVRFNYFSGRPEADELTYRRRTPFGDLAFTLSGLMRDETQLHVSKSYARFIKYRIMNLHSADYVLSDIIAFRLLRLNLSPLYCSAFSLAGETYVVMAPSRTGKTLTAEQACFDGQAQLLSEDLAITDGSTIFAAPWTNSSHQPKLLQRRLHPTLLHESPPFTQPRDEPITHLVFLQRSSQESVSRIDSREGFRRAETLNRLALHHSLSPALIAASYLNTEIDLFVRLTSGSEVLKRLTDSVHDIHILSSPDPRRFYAMLPVWT